jgi:hypothetical protein
MQPIAELCPEPAGWQSLKEKSMKIEHLSIVPPAPAPVKATPAAESGFNNYLAQALTPDQAPPSPSLPIPVSSEIIFQPQTELRARPETPWEEEPYLRLSERLLVSLEEYQIGLANPKTTLKETAKRLERMEEDLRVLTPMLEKLPDSSQGRMIMEEISALALAQSIKFRRGDYLD